MSRLVDAHLFADQTEPPIIMEVETGTRKFLAFRFDTDDVPDDVSSWGLSVAAEYATVVLSLDGKSLAEPPVVDPSPPPFNAPSLVLNQSELGRADFVVAPDALPNGVDEYAGNDSPTNPTKQAPAPALLCFAKVQEGADPVSSIIEKYRIVVVFRRAL